MRNMIACILFLAICFLFAPAVTPPASATADGPDQFTYYKEKEVRKSWSWYDNLTDRWASITVTVRRFFVNGVLENKTKTSWVNGLATTVPTFRIRYLVMAMTAEFDDEGDYEKNANRRRWKENRPVKG